MQGIQQRERNIDRRRLGVLQLRPTRLFVGFDRGLLLRQRQPEPHVRVHVAVRNVMRHLSYCPAAVAIGRVQLLFAQALYGSAQLDGCLRDSRNRLLPQGWRRLLWRRVLSDGIARIHVFLLLRARQARPENIAAPADWGQRGRLKTLSPIWLPGGQPKAERDDVTIPLSPHRSGGAANLIIRERLNA